MVGNLFRNPILTKRTFCERGGKSEFSFILCIALFPYYGDSSGAILEVPSEALLHLSVVGRWNEARYKRRKRDGNLNKSTFLSFGVLWSFLGSSLVSPWSFIRSIYIRYKGVES